MNILITGSSGFIGHYFIKNNSAGHSISTFSFQKDDINAIELSGTDTVLHLAALVHQMKGIKDNNEYFKVNTDYTIQLAEKAKKAGVKHFIFMSSIKVYGDKQTEPFTEDSTCQPDDPYGKSKLKAEKSLFKLADATFTVSIIRTPVVYGEGVKANILNLVKLANKIPLLPFGGIKNQRSMVYVGNLTALISKIIEKKTGGIFLASDYISFSTTKLIQEIANILEKKVILLNIPGFPLLLRTLKPNIYTRLYDNLAVNAHKTNKILDFTPPYSNYEGLENMIKWYKNSI